jgi:hypothetical protein
LLKNTFRGLSASCKDKVLNFGLYIVGEHFPGDYLHRAKIRYLTLARILPGNTFRILSVRCITKTYPSQV